MISRYTRPIMQAVWGPEAKWRRIAKVEEAVLHARELVGELAVKVPDGLADSLKIDPSEIDRIEREVTRHDITAFLRHTSPQLPKEIRQWWHHRLTSNDVQDTALSLTLSETLEILGQDLDSVMLVVERRAKEHKNTPMIGRTHLVHAEPITFGVMLAVWYSELQRQRMRLRRLFHEVRKGKISGVVGMFTLDPRVEEITCKLLELDPVPASQVIPRDIIADYLSVLANLAGTVASICNTFRVMQMTEVLEVEEYFDPEQEGSSAMPHKRNPKSFEQIFGLSTTMPIYALGGFINQNFLFQRDLPNSSRERLLLPDSSALMDYILDNLREQIDKLIVYPENMMKNLNLTKGLIYSQEVQALVAKRSGLPRTEAYSLVKAVAQRCWTGKKDFLEELLWAPSIMRFVSEAELRACFDLQAKLKYVPFIFERIFGSK